MFRDYNDILPPSRHSYVISDSETDKPKQRPMVRLPMSFWIDYGKKIKEPPGLTLLINPQNMTTSFSKVINQNYSRGGFVIEEWGEQQDVIKCSGMIGGYYISEMGLNRYNRTRSLSYQDLQSLFLIYRNNGAIYQRAIQETSRKKRTMSFISKIDLERERDVVLHTEDKIYEMGNVYMSFDGTIYQGAFDDFSIDESSDRPYNLEYSFSFTVERKVFYDQSLYTNLDGKNKTGTKTKDTVSKLKTLSQNNVESQQTVSANTITTDRQEEYFTLQTIEKSKRPEAATQITEKRVKQQTNKVINSENRNKIKEGFIKQDKGTVNKNYSLKEEGKRDVEQGVTNTAGLEFLNIGTDMNNMYESTRNFTPIS